MEFEKEERWMNHYILNGHEIVPCEDVLEWMKWFEKPDCHVGYDKKKGILVSTVFLGRDHNFGSKGLPILFETMVFGGEHDGEQERYSTWEEAEEGHKKMCEIVFA